jgi:redox-sensitive bicupin YhaK (pirin superfamily)
MSAGTGITHSEYNPSPTVLHFLQIWILPQRTGLPPGYEQRAFPVTAGAPGLRLVASGDGRQGSVTLHQEVDLFAGSLDAGGQVVHSLRAGRHAWLQVARGAIMLNQIALSAGDGAAVSDEPMLHIGADTGSEVLLFDLT